MVQRISTDQKTVKMFRRLEKFLDDLALDGHEMIDFQNAETGRVFAVFLSPAAFKKVDDYIEELTADLEESQETIEILADDNLLLNIIDLQNSLIQEWADQDAEEDVKGDGAEEGACACRTTEAVLGSTFTELKDGDDLPPGWAFAADVTIKEHFAVEEVTVTLQEYEELLNLRVKRANDHKQLSAMDAKLKEKKKAIHTLEDSRDHWKAEYYELEEKCGVTEALLAAEKTRADFLRTALEATVTDALKGDDDVTRWIR